MLRLVEHMLQELKLVAPGTAVQYYVNITSGESLAISAFVDGKSRGGRFVQIKASEYLNLAAQYASYSSAWNDYGAFVPQPLGYREIEGWSIIVSAGAEHTMAHPRRVLSSGRNGASSLSRQLLDFFGRGAAIGGARCGHTELLGELQEFFAPTPFADTAARCIAQAEVHGVAGLRQTPQHGDFVFNNLVWSHGKLVIFDWEDYRKVFLPGLDIWILVMSMLDQDVCAVRAVVEPGSRPDAQLESFLEQACTLQGLTLVQFRGLVPLYLLAFLHLKRNYGIDVQERISNILTQLAPPAAPMQRLLAARSAEALPP